MPVKDKRDRRRYVTHIRVGAVALGILTLICLQVATVGYASPSLSPARLTKPKALSPKHSVRKSAIAKPKVAAPATRIQTRPSASVGAFETIVQTLNNCGPSSISEVLAYWHVYRTQSQVAAVMRADDSAFGMSPVDLPAYARSLGLRALVGYGGSEQLVKLLIANGFPVIASQYVSSWDQIRHYRPIISYSNAARTFVSDDPYLGADHVISYAEFNTIWAESHNRFLVVYPVVMQARLSAVLRAGGWSATATYSAAIRWEEARLKSPQTNGPGSWSAHNGYADIAFDQAQVGLFKQATATLALAKLQGTNATMIAWVSNEIHYLEAHR